MIKIDNEYIQYIDRLENGHYVIQLNKAHSGKFTRFFNFCEKEKFDRTCYESDGKLVVFDRKSVLTFLSTGEKILTKELVDHFKRALLSQLITSSSYCPSLGFFPPKGKERISSVRLAMIAQWAYRYANGKENNALLIHTRFNEIFEVVLPREKRKKIEGTPFFEGIIGNNGLIENNVIAQQIGDDFKKFDRFRQYAIKVMNYPGCVEDLAQTPQNTGRDWNILLSGEKPFKALIVWLEKMITDGVNPLTQDQYNPEELLKLEKLCRELNESYLFLTEPEKKLHIQVSNTFIGDDDSSTLGDSIEDIAGPSQ